MALWCMTSLSVLESTGHMKVIGSFFNTAKERAESFAALCELLKLQQGASDTGKINRYNTR